VSREPIFLEEERRGVRAIRSSRAGNDGFTKKQGNKTNDMSRSL
jgi:hypothetical protein